MKQIFIFGSSTAHGVGGQHGGLGDRLKVHLHQQMYATGGPGEIAWVHDFTKGGATVDFVADNFPSLLEQYRLPESTVIVILHIGSNNTKALQEPDNFVSTSEDYAEQMTGLLKDLKTQVDQLFVLGYRPCDETKTTPKTYPNSDRRIYYWNSRIKEFNTIQRDYCLKNDITFVEPCISDEEWIATCLYPDGNHPNDKGHQVIFEAVKELIIL